MRKWQRRGEKEEEVGGRRVVEREKRWKGNGEKGEEVVVGIVEGSDKMWRREKKRQHEEDNKE